MTSSLGLTFMLQGISSMIGPPIVGAIYDKVGNFDIGFYIAGGLFVASSFCTFAAEALNKSKTPQGNSENQNNPVSGPIEVPESTL